MFVYRMPSTQVVARVLKFPRNKKTGEEIFNDDVFRYETKLICDIGYREWLKLHNETEASFLRKLNKQFNLMEPFTVMVDYSHG